MAVLFRIETMWIQHTAWAPQRSQCEQPLRSRIRATFFGRPGHFPTMSIIHDNRQRWQDGWTKSTVCDNTAVWPREYDCGDLIAR
jgi:hypothetical protein